MINNLVSNLAPLQDLTRLNGTRATNLWHIGIIASLRDLGIYDTGTANLDILSSLFNLRGLTVGFNPVSTLAP